MRSFRIKRTPIDSDKSPTVNPLSQSYAAVSVEQPWAVVGARAVVVKDVSAGTVVAGNPARVVGLRRMNAS